MRRQLRYTLLAMGLILGIPGAATEVHAQAGAACPISREAPVAMSVSSYTLSAADACKMLVFSNTTAATVTMPNPATALPSGFKVWIKAQGSGGVTLNTPAGGALLDGASTTVAISQHDGIGVRSDAINYYTTGLGVAH